MDTLIIYPSDGAQLRAIKAVLKAMKVPFESYPNDVVKGVNESLRQADEGKLTPYTGIKDMIEAI